MPIIAQRGETAFTPGQMRVLGSELGHRPEVHVNNRAQWRTDGNGDLNLDIVAEQIEGQIGRNIGRGEGLAPTLERRYGLDPAAGSNR